MQKLMVAFVQLQIVTNTNHDTKGGLISVKVRNGARIFDLEINTLVDQFNDNPAMSKVYWGFDFP
jgi:hypothetical protein